MCNMLNEVILSTFPCKKEFVGITEDLSHHGSNGWAQIHDKCLYRRHGKRRQKGEGCRKSEAETSGAARSQGMPRATSTGILGENVLLASINMREQIWCFKPPSVVIC